MEKTWRARLAFVIALALVLTACESGAPTAAPSSGAPVPGGTVRFTWTNDMALGLHFTGVQLGRDYVTAQVYDSLYRHTLKGGLTDDGLAESTRVSADALTWTLTLRQGVKFHDGTPFNAEAVKINLDARKAEPTFPFRGQLEPVRDVRVVDSRTVELRLSAPSASLRTVLASNPFGMQSPTAMTKYPAIADYVRNAAGTGPYKLSGTPDETLVTLVRNDEYWGGAAHVEKLEMITIPDPASALLSLDAGEIDVMNVGRLSGSELTRIKTEAKYNLLSSGSDTELKLWFNNAKGIFTDVRVRQAILYGTNREQYLALSPGNSLADSLYLPSSFGYKADKPWPFDPAKARQLLADAGIAPGTTFRFIAGDISPIYSQVAQLVVQDLDRIGLKAQLKMVDIATWRALTGVSGDKTAWELGLLGASIPYPDAEAFFFRFVYGPNSAPAGNNWGHYKNPSLDKLLVEQQAIQDPAKRAAALQQLHKMVWDDAPLHTILRIGVLFASPKWLADLDFTARGVPLFHVARRTSN